MPSPLVHSATGYVIWRLIRTSLDRRGPGAPVWGLAALVLCIGVSIVPDFDFIVGMLAGNPGAYHNQFMNSAVAAGIVSLIAAALARSLAGIRFGLALAAALACYGTHLLMDFWTHGRGLKLLWPFTDHRFQPPFPVFYGVRWSQGCDQPSPPLDPA